MLVLSRKQDESFIINGNIEVVITGIQGNKVSLGIAAPSDVSIFRKELCSATVEKMGQKIASNSKSVKRNCWSVLHSIQALR